MCVTLSVSLQAFPNVNTDIVRGLWSRTYLWDNSVAVHVEVQALPGSHGREGYSARWALTGSHRWAVQTAATVLGAPPSRN